MRIKSLGSKQIDPTAMWNHPVTFQNIAAFQGWGFLSFIQPITKLLACGDLGIGAMEETVIIAEHVKQIILKKDS